MASAEFVRFRFSFFEDTDWARQGLDVLSLLALGAKERERAEEMLLDYLPDVRGVIGLGVLRSPRAEPVLAGMIETERGSEPRFTLVELAKALWQIRPDVRWLDVVTEALASAGQSVGAPARCRSALCVPRSSSRARACKGARRSRGAGAPPCGPRPSGDSRAFPLAQRPAAHGVPGMSGDAGRREGGKQDIRAAIAGRQIEVC